MTFRIRRVLFYGLVVVFIFIGAGMVLYSQGWRFNFQTFFFQKVGAIYIETKPSDVIIKIDNKEFLDKSGLIQSGTLISNLLPRKYKVELQKNGYYPWNKTLIVKPSMVAEIINAILIPEKIETKTISLLKPINNFWLQNQNIIFEINHSFYYASLNTSSAPTIKKIKFADFAEWDAKGERFFLKDSKNGIYDLYETSNLSKRLNLNDLLSRLEKEKMSIKKIAFHPLEANKVIVETIKRLIIIDTKKLTLETLFSPSPLNWTIYGSNIYLAAPAEKQIAEKSATQKTKIPPTNFALFSLNLANQNKTIITSLPQNFPRNISELKTSPAVDRIGLLTENGALFLYDQKTQIVEEIAQSIRDFQFSADNKKIALLDKHNELKIYFLEDYQRETHKKTGDFIELTPTLNAVEQNAIIKNISWYKDSLHLIIQYSDHLGFIEIDDRPPINYYLLTEQSSEFYYDTRKNIIYYLQQGALHSFQILK